MFNTIMVLLSIAFWAVSIFLLLGGVVLCIGNITEGSVFQKLISFISIALGICAFLGVYGWLESIVCALFASGAVLCMFNNESSDNAKNAKSSSSVMHDDSDDRLFDQVRSNGDVRVKNVLGGYTYSDGTTSYEDCLGAEHRSNGEEVYNIGCGIREVYKDGEKVGIEYEDCCGITHRE